jgi:hypothetical protein
MIRRIFNFVQKPTGSNYSEPSNVSAFDRHHVEPESTLQPRNDATRPSYRVGKHKISDIYKALDMGG